MYTKDLSVILQICIFCDIKIVSSYLDLNDIINFTPIYAPFEKGGAYLCPPLKKEGHIALHMSVGRYVGRSVSQYPLTLCN